MPAPTAAPPLVDGPQSAGTLRTLGTGHQQAMPGDTTLDQIPAGFTINSFGGPASPVRVGATVTNPSFTASYNRAAASVTLNDGVTGPLAVTLPGTSFAYNAGGLPAESYTSSVINHVQSWTLTAYENASYPKTRGASVQWEPDEYWGVSTDPGSYNAAFVTGLAHSALQASRARGGDSFTTGANQFMFWGIPTTYGGSGANFIDVATGFAAGVASVGTVDVTNANGVVINYTVWRSDNSNIGTVTIKVT